MSKKNNLKDYLTDLYEGIRSKIPSASRNPQDFRREIESIKVDTAEMYDGAVVITQTIVFAINTDIYQAEIGMTWYDWCNSRYNTSPFSCEAEDGEVHDTLHEYFVSNDGTLTGQIFGNDIILHNNSYLTFTKE